MKPPISPRKDQFCVHFYPSLHYFPLMNAPVSDLFSATWAVQLFLHRKPTQLQIVTLGPLCKAMFATYSGTRTSSGRTLRTVRAPWRSELCVLVFRYRRAPLRRPRQSSLCGPTPFSRALSGRRLPAVKSIALLMSSNRRPLLLPTIRDPLFLFHP